MTCETTRQRLLQSERPDRPPADVQPHLAACSACRTWQRRLTRIERQIPELPVPPSAPPPDLLRRILNGPPPLPIGPVPGLTGGSPPWWVNATEVDRQGPTIEHRNRRESSPHNDRARRKVALAFALTMGLAVFALCWGLWPQSPSQVTTTSTIQASRQARFERQLASARTPNERIHVLDNFAGDLEREALALVHKTDADDLKTVASLYVRVLNERLPEFAQSLPRHEREIVLKQVAERLDNTESKMQHLLSGEVSPAAAAPLREMANAAREGSNRLWAMLREV